MNPTRTHWWLIGIGLMLAALAAGCGSGESQAAGRPESAPRATAPSPARAGASRDPRTQYDLARDIASAEAMDAFDAEERYGAIQRDWRGKRYRWSVRYIAATCPSPDHCNALPFDRERDPEKVVQGWMPRLALTPADHAALAARCAGKPGCRFTFEGTLAALNLSTEEFTSLSFADVRVFGE